MACKGPGIPIAREPKPSVFTFIGDIHLSQKQPRQRLDSLYDEVVDLLWEACREIQNRPFLGGDLCHRPYWSAREFYDIRSIMGSITRERGVAEGNHDMVNYGVPGTPTGFRLLTGQRRKDTYIPCDQATLHVQVVDAGEEFPKIFSSASFSENALTRATPPVYNILIAHAPIGPKQIMDYCQDFRKVKYPEGTHLALLSDIHQPFGPEFVGETLVVNPGVIGRRTKAEKDIHPSYVRITVTDDLEVELVPLPALPGWCVFKPDEVKESATEVERIIVPPKVEARDPVGLIRECASLLQ